MGTATVLSKQDIDRISNARRRRYFLWRRSPWCNYCNKLLTFDEATLDHIYPKKWGGNNRASNMQILCMRCNRIKGSDIYSQEELEVLKELLAEDTQIQKDRELETIIQEMLNELTRRVGQENDRSCPAGSVMV